MTTFEIIRIAEELNKINNREVERLEYHLESGYRIDVIAEEDGYWSVYLDEYDSEEEIWVSVYLSTHSVFSMTGAIAEAIDNIIAAEKEYDRNF